MSNAFIPDQLDNMSRKELLEFSQTAHEENVKLVKRIAELESYNVRLANESHEYQQRCAELEKQLQPDMFWNSDGDMSFDSIEELFDYYAEGDRFEIDCRTAFGLPDRTYRGVYDESNNEWVITELRKEQDDQ